MRIVVVLFALCAAVDGAAFGSGCCVASTNCSDDRRAPPPLSPMDNPTTKPGYKPVQMPMPTPQPVSYNPNSLWRNGSRAFFKDQRAHQVGDILTVKVNINDTAQFQDQTQLSRTSTEDSGITNFIGANTIRNPAKAVLPGSLLTANSNSQSERQRLDQPPGPVGDQRRRRGHPVAAERQHGDRRQAGGPAQFRDARTVVAGVVRPEDIESDNTIDLPKIAEARLAYGGQRPAHEHSAERWGQQALDVILPF